MGDKAYLCLWNEQKDQHQGHEIQTRKEGECPLRRERAQHPWEADGQHRGPEHGCRNGK